MRPRPAVGLAVVGALVVLVSGCAAHRAPGLAGRFIRGADIPAEDMTAWPVAVEPSAAIAPVASGPPPAGPAPKSSDLPTVEAEDAGLAGALARLGAGRSAGALRSVALEYRRLGVFDQALDYLERALRVDRADAATLVALAQVWRDWGVPARALPEAYRAVHADPSSPAAHNTLGVLLFSLGDFEAARARFERVLVLEPGAAYAHSNLCYLWFSRGDQHRAIEWCREALRIDPALTSARHNLALVHAAAGRWAEAAGQFERGSADAGRARFNLGLALLAGGQHLRAVDAFDLAGRMQPALAAMARQRADEARRLAAAIETVSGGRK